MHNDDIMEILNELSQIVGKIDIFAIFWSLSILTRPGGGRFSQTM